ncbi:MAG: B12-binding domain-containing protein, partial [Prevotella sp.]|nr:B12-binding domain-containing protein [Prevotella sp.]
MENLNNIYEAVLKGNLPLAVESAQKAITENVDPQIIINDYMSKAMEEIGSRFESGQAFVPELLMSARAMKGALDLL